jgi:hypothetical protein
VKRAAFILCLVPVVLAVIFWIRPPRGDDSYHHTINAVEQARAWREGAVYPRYHRGWNHGTGSFLPTIYSPIPLSVQGGLAWMLGDAQRAVGISLAIAMLVGAVSLVGWSGRPIVAVVVLAPYLMTALLARSTTTEAWALAAAAMVLPLALPPVRASQWRGLGLAVGVALVAGCQVGMLLQLGWLLGAAWAVKLLMVRRKSIGELAESVRALAFVGVWSASGLMTAAVLWVPAVVDARNLAIAELVSGPFDWRNNFLPDGSELGMLLTATAVSLAMIGLIVAVRGERAVGLPQAVAVGVGVFISSPLSTPLWQLPKMENLQFPWRILGPTTLIAVIALASLGRRWRTIAVVILLVPLCLLPVRIGPREDSVPTASTPEEAAMIAHRQWGLLPILPTTTGSHALGYHRLESVDRLSRQSPRFETVARDALGGSWRVHSDHASVLLLPIQWWPEWRVAIGDRDTAYTNRWGLVAIEIDAGTTSVRATIGPSRSRRIGAVVSALGLSVLLLLVLGVGRCPVVSPGRRG